MVDINFTLSTRVCKIGNFIYLFLHEFNLYFESLFYMVAEKFSNNLGFLQVYCNVLEELSKSYIIPRASMSFEHLLSYPPAVWVSVVYPGNCQTVSCLLQLSFFLKS